MAKFSIENALGFGFRTTLKHWGLLVSVSAVCFLLTVTIAFTKVWILGEELQLMGVHLPDGTLMFQFPDFGQKGVVLIAVIQVVLVLLFEAIRLGVIRMGLDLYDSGQSHFDVIFGSFRYLFTYIVASILYILMVLAGCMLFFVPGIYLAMRYWAFSYLIVDKDMGIIDSLRKSAAITEDSKWHLLGYSIVAGVLIHVGYITILGIVIIWPAIQLANVYVYRKLSPLKKLATKVM